MPKAAINVAVLVLAGLGIPALVFSRATCPRVSEPVASRNSRLSVAEYHPPYVAVWLANSKRKAVLDLAIWYDTKLVDREGEKWLKDFAFGGVAVVVALSPCRWRHGRDAPPWRGHP